LNSLRSGGRGFNQPAPGASTIPRNRGFSGAAAPPVFTNATTLGGGAAVYDKLSTNYSSLGVKPVDDNKASQYQNSDHAGTPENFKSNAMNGVTVIGGATGGGGSNYTGGYSGTVTVGPF